MPDAVAQQRDQPDRGGRLEVAVVRAAAEPVEEAGRDRLEVGAEAGQQAVAVGRELGRRHPLLDGRAGQPQRHGLGVDGQRGLVAEQVADHRAQHERELRRDRRHGERLHRGAEALVPLGGDDDRRGLVGPVDRHLLGHVVGVRALQAGRAHEDERLGRQVDVLLVLGGVAGDGLVAELGELDPQLHGGDPVGAGADDRPVPLRRRELVRRRGDGRSRGQASAPSRRGGRGARRACGCARPPAPGPPPPGRRWRRRGGSPRPPASRRPWWRRRSSPRRARRTCRARRRTCR